jgi:hypothetical protein
VRWKSVMKYSVSVPGRLDPVEGHTVPDGEVRVAVQRQVAQRDHPALLGAIEELHVDVGTAQRGTEGGELLVEFARLTLVGVERHDLGEDEVLEFLTGFGEPVPVRPQRDHPHDGPDGERRHDDQQPAMGR